MLVALLRTNPDAFIDGNINRIKSGALLTVPTAGQTAAISASEAGQTVTAQSKDFNDFRRKLAGSAASAQVAAPDRRSSGKVQAKVEDSKPGAGAPDKLTLSKGAVQAQAAVDKIAKEREAQEATSKAAELSKNISELGKIGAASSPAVPSAAASAVGPGVPAVALAASSPKAVASSAGPTQAAAPASATVAVPLPAPAPAVAKRTAPVVPPQPAADRGFIDQLLENPLVPAGAAGLVALLAGFAFYRSRKQKKAMQEDSAFLESRLQPDSFFGASGGQRVDTNDGVQTGSSMVYSPSQLDAADDVDPVAEADVYLAYGRDMQAEEILKEASKANPARVAIQQKLLEIYAKRRDAKSFERVANEVYKLSGDKGTDWQRVCELGLGIDASNALYQPGGQPSRAVIASRPMGLDRTAGFNTNTVPQALAAGSTKAVDLDLDLDFSLEEENASIVSELRSTDPRYSMDRVNTAPSPLDANRIADTKALLASGMTGSAVKQDTVNFELPGLDVPTQKRPAERDAFRSQAAASYGSTTPIPLAPSEPAKSAHGALDSGLLEFDLGSLSLDLGDSTGAASATTAIASEPEDPLTTKLSLAEEFNAIGDDEGARALIEEVIAEASGDMKLRAQQALSRLG